MRIANSVLDLVGQTPVVKINKLGGQNRAEIWAKLESANPGGSVKDRIALNMIEDAEKQGKLTSESTIVEPTSGNTGIGLAMVAAAKGYKLILCMPETMSVERRTLLNAYGAELVLTPGDQGMKGAIAKANEILQENSNYFMPQQFENPANPEVHKKTTAEEVLTQTNGALDAFVAGVGTGGTITGVGEVLKTELPSVKIIAVEPGSSPILSGGAPGPHRIQGIGAGFVPTVLNAEIYDEVIKVNDSEAFEMASKLAKQEGLLVGISAGAAMVAALQIANKLGKGKKVVVILPDTGERYLSINIS